MTSRFEGFADTSCSFFKKLAKNQNKEWFAAHKAEYEDGWHTPMVAFLAEAKEKLESAYPHVDLGEPKVMRIYRDVRFSKDKSPYKTNVGGGVPIKIGGGGMMEAPSALFMHVGVSGDHACFAGAGSYMLDPPKLARLRNAILDDKRGKELETITKPLQKKGFEFHAAETLKKVPKGIDPDHPRARWLKMKGLVVSFPDFPQKDLASRKVLEWTLKSAKVAAPLVEWISFAIA